SSGAAELPPHATTPDTRRPNTPTDSMRARMTGGCIRVASASEVIRTTVDGDRRYSGFSLSLACRAGRPGAATGAFAAGLSATGAAFGVFGAFGVAAAAAAGLAVATRFLSTWIRRFAFTAGLAGFASATFASAFVSVVFA